MGVNAARVAPCCTTKSSELPVSSVLGADCCPTLNVSTQHCKAARFKGLPQELLSVLQRTQVVVMLLLQAGLRKC